MRRAAVWTALVAVVAGTALLLWPHAPRVETYSVSTGRHTVELTVDDPRTGTNTLELTAARSDGSPVTADTLTVDLVMPTMGHAAPPVTASSTGPGRFSASDATFSMGGSWEITVRLPGQDRAVFSVPVR
ncbi:FixH family protein [Promicromonospora sp. NPDC052451]|uniref:FixH family protein n=1 Tax=Promicromonospora sp. NPDC052451 TaxID=3364407 RepID=UPI0037C5AD1B